MSKGHSTFLEYRIYRKKFLGTIIVVIVLCLSAFSGVLFFFIRNWVNDVQIQSQYRFQQKERQLEKCSDLDTVLCGRLVHRCGADGRFKGIVWRCEQSGLHREAPGKQFEQ